MAEEEGGGRRGGSGGEGVIVNAFNYRRYQEFTDVSAIIALLRDFHVALNVECRRHQERKTGGEQESGRRKGNLIRLVGKINAVHSKRTGSAPDARIASLLFRGRGKASLQSGRCNLQSDAHRRSRLDELPLSVIIEMVAR